MNHKNRKAAPAAALMACLAYSPSAAAAPDLTAVERAVASGAQAAQRADRGDWSGAKASSGKSFEAGQDSGAPVDANGGGPAEGKPPLGLPANSSAGAASRSGGEPVPAPEEPKKSHAFKRGFLWTEFPLKVAAGDDLAGIILLAAFLALLAPAIVIGIGAALTEPIMHWTDKK